MNKNETSNPQHPTSREDPRTKIQYQPLLGVPLDLECWILDLLWRLDVGCWRFLNMRLGTVIGRVTLSKTVPALIGARWLLVSPFTREHYQRGAEQPFALGKEPSLVIYDNLGAAAGQ